MDLLIDISLDLSPNAQVFAYLIKKGEYELAEKFEARFNYYPDQPNKSLRDELFDNSIVLNKPDNLQDLIFSSRKKTSKELNEFIGEILEDFRDKFKNKKTGSMGSKSACKNKLEVFLKEYPEYLDKDLILRATERYINSCRKDGFKYLMQADYFIYKQRNDGGGNTSTLAAYCEEVSALTESNISTTGKNLMGL